VSIIKIRKIIISNWKNVLKKTHSRYVRKDGAFGDFILLPNGTWEVTRMSYFAYHNKADIIIQNHMMTLQRLEHLDFLPPLSPLKWSIWIKNELEEEFTFNMYTNPLSWQLWAVIFGVAILISTLFSMEELFLIKTPTSLICSHFIYSILYYFNSFSILIIYQSRMFRT
jgi:hypothetical protein